MVERRSALQIVRADGCVGDGHAAGHHRLQALEFEVALDLEFELVDGQTEGGLDEVDVLVLADILAVGEDVLRVRAVLQIALQVLIGDLEAEAIGFLREHGALDFKLAGAAHHQGQILLRQAILLQLLHRDPLHSVGLDRGGVAIDLAQPTRRADLGVDGRVGGCAVVEDAGDESDGHGTDGDHDDDAKDGFNYAVVLLQNADHAWLTTFTSGASRERLALPGILRIAWCLSLVDAPRLLAGAHREV
jgi:hypothetical protein